MIKPIDTPSGNLEFECGACRTIFSHTIRIYHDAPTNDEAQEYDVRNWTVAGLELQCPRCFAERTYKLAIRPEKRRGVM
jgi:phage FluMu protein Com